VRKMIGEMKWENQFALNEVGKLIGESGKDDLRKRYVDLREMKLES
jgi:hypothetical protein